MRTKFETYLLMRLMSYYRCVKGVKSIYHEGYDSSKGKCPEVKGINRRVDDSETDKTTKELIASIKKKFIGLEDRSRRSNLCLDDFKEKTKETWEKSEKVVNNFVKAKLRMQSRKYYNEII